MASLRNSSALLARFFVAFLGATLLMTQPAWSEKLPAPAGSVILTVDGEIANTTDGAQAYFDREMLQALGTRERETSNPFVKGVHRYEGVLLSDLLDHVGSSGTVLVATALDDYTVDIPIADARNYPILIAMRMDGKVMRIRGKGPLWIIYPVDQYDDLRAESFSNRSIWQLKHLTVK